MKDTADDLDYRRRRERVLSLLSINPTSFILYLLCCLHGVLNSSLPFAARNNS